MANRDPFVLRKVRLEGLRNQSLCEGRGRFRNAPSGAALRTSDFEEVGDHFISIRSDFGQWAQEEPDHQLVSGGWLKGARDMRLRAPMREGERSTITMSI
jgi:hypothetical protein